MQKSRLFLTLCILLIILGVGNSVFSPTQVKNQVTEIKSISIASQSPIPAIGDVAGTSSAITDANSPPVATTPSQAPIQSDLYTVTNVVDGDTIDVNINGKIERLRLIGMDTPETVDPRKPVQCFGKEASDKAKALLTGKKVRLEADPTQGELDKYQRLLRYVFIEDGTFFNKWMIASGYAHEYTYNLPYKYMDKFKQAQRVAQQQTKGLWSSTTCNGDTTSAATTSDKSQTNGSCNIKGNISSGGKIYHLPNCGSYSRTTINTAVGERWFCTEQEALNAGWRKALNC